MTTREFLSACKSLGFEAGYFFADVFEAYLPLGNPLTCTDFVYMRAIRNDDDTIGDIQVGRSHAEPNGSRCVTDITDTCTTIADIQMAVQAIRA